ncbi:lipoprotein [Gallaecimonas kandeliae]|nr:lipoprotein [Gallaecimonas kandeliae]WKE65570.1 lipoprotein [Gallaecimonas kandeliae]
MRKRLLLLALFGLLLGGCGQKGPLYTPDQPQNNQPGEQQP